MSNMKCDRLKQIRIKETANTSLFDHTPTMTLIDAPPTWPILVGGTAMNKTELTDFQQEKVAQYQAALAAVGGRRSEVDEQGREALELLLESLRRLVRYRVLSMLEGRYGKEWAADLAEDFVGEAELALLEAAGEYDISKGALFRTWIFSNGGPVNTALRNAIDVHDGVTHLTRGERVVLRYVSAILVEIQDVDGSYCAQTLQERVEGAVYGYARGVAAKALERSGVSATSANFEALLDKRVDERLRKDGILKALRNVPALLQSTSRGLVTLETDSDGTGWSGALSVTDGVEEDVVARYSPGVREEQILAMATVGMSDEERVAVRDVLTGDSDGGAVDMSAVQERLSSPLAQFAVLSPTVGMQVTHTD